MCQQSIQASVLLLTGKHTQQQTAHSMHVFPGPEFNKHTSMLMVEGRTFVSVEFMQQQQRELQQLLQESEAQLQSAKVAMGVSKEALLTALEENQMHVEMLQEYVLTLAHALLLTDKKEKRTLLEDGSVLLHLSAAEVAALDTALDCIKPDNGDTLNEQNRPTAPGT